VRIAELEAEAQKARDVKQAEAQAQVRVLQAKAESDSMQYTLPLKQKQIEQTKLEAQARKESTIQNAEAAAQAKVIDSKAEIERQKNLADAEANRIRVTADAEANRIRVTAAADSERMKFEASVLKSNPMLIQKIVAERLSDKLQIMMVPIDGKNFFANDVMRSAFSGVTGGRIADLRMTIRMTQHRGRQQRQPRNTNSRAGPVMQKKRCAPPGKAVPAGSASQYPCGWYGTRRSRGGKIMSTKAGTAALDPISQRLFLLPATRLAPPG